MDNVIGTLIYKITGDTTALNVNLARSRDQVVQTGVAIEKMGGNIRRVATTVISGILIKSLTEAASRVEELENKFDTVFKGMEAEADAWARTYADATSRGVIATKEFLATQQDLRTGYGDTTEQAAKYSQAVVGITNDLASFSNVPVEEAMAAMFSGLNQQFEALRRLGVGLNVAIIDQGAYAKAIGKTWEQMSNLERQEAILSGIVSQSKNALHQEIQFWQEYDYTLGDAVLTADSYANVSQGFKQTLADLSSELGDSLLPAATGVLGIALDGMQTFNSWSDSTQSLTISLAALAAIAVKVGGSLGLMLGSIAAVAIYLSGQKDSSEKLTSATRSLSSASGEYLQVSRQLAESTDTMTAAERNLLEVRQQIAGLKAQAAMSEVVEQYDDAADDLQAAQIKLDKVKGQLKALELGKQGKNTVLTWINHLGNSEDLSEYEKSLRENLNLIAYDYEGFEKTYNNLVVHSNRLFGEASADVAAKLAPLKESILSVAQAYNAGTIDISSYRYTHEGLYNEIIAMADELKANTDKVITNTNAVSKAVSVGQNWKKQLMGQKAALAEQSGNYQRATALRLSLSRIEKEEAIRKIATDAKLVQEGENVNDLSINTLRQRIKGSDGAYKELLALDEYYANEKVGITQDGVDAERDLANQIAASIRDQDASRQQAVASDLESQGHIEAAYRIRLQVLQDGRAAEREILAQQVEDKQATQAELDAFDQVTLAQETALEDERGRKLVAARKATAEELKNADLQQRVSMMQSAASELESLDQTEAAYDLRLEALRLQRTAEREELEKKVADKRATDDDLTAYDKITADLELELQNEKDRKLTAARKSTAEETKKALLQQRVSMQQSVASDLESLGQTQAAYELRLETLRLQRAAEREELEKKVADNKATADDLIAYDKITADQELELQNEKDRKLAAARKSSAEATTKAVLQQQNSVKQSLASELESAGHIEAAYRMRIEILQSQRALERDELEKKVADNRATDEDLVAFDKITAEQQIEIEREKNRKLTAARKESAKQIKDQLASQRGELLGQKAAELEQVGSFRAATDVRLGLLHTERDEAIRTMQQKVANHTATQKDMDDLNIFYANKETQLHKEQTEKIKDFWLDMFGEVASFAKDVANGLGELWSTQTDARIAEIDRQTQAQLAALGLQEESEAEKLRKEYAEAVKNGDMKTAKEKADALERLRIEEEADDKKKKLQREQAERDRDIKVFGALIDTAAAVIRFMSDPGGWPGLALSAMAAVTGGMQVAAIQSQPLPSFAVGIAEVPQDMVARIHQGEMIVPKTYAQSVRDGDVSIGGAGGAANVAITIINNTGAEVSTSRDDETDITRYTILIGNTVDKQIRDGRYDRAMGQRYNIKEAGRNG